MSLTGGNRNDVTRLMPLLAKIPSVPGLVGRPRRRPDVLLGDRGYDHDKYRRLVWARGIKPVIARRGVAHVSGLAIHRWVVERTIAWFHGFRRLRIRWERRDDIHEALLGLATCLITHRHGLAPTGKKVFDKAMPNRQPKLRACSPRAESTGLRSRRGRSWAAHLRSRGEHAPSPSARSSSAAHLRSSRGEPSRRGFVVLVPSPRRRSTGCCSGAPARSGACEGVELGGEVGVGCGQVGAGGGERGDDVGGVVVGEG